MARTPGTATGMEVGELLLELYGRLPALVRTAAGGLDAGELRLAPAERANPVGWLVWHLTRVQDHHVAELLGPDQRWPEHAAGFGLTPDPEDTGYGHTPAEVASVRPARAEVLIEYHEAVHARTVEYLRGLTPADLDRVVDERWDPPVTLGVRLVSVADDALQHAGQAAYVRGLFSD